MTGPENRIGVTSSDGISEQASRNTLALNPLVGISGQDLVDSAGVLFKAIVSGFTSMLSARSGRALFVVRSRTVI